MEIDCKSGKKKGEEEAWLGIEKERERERGLERI